MIRSSTIALFLLSSLLVFVISGCSKITEPDPSREGELKGTYTGTATNKANSNDKKTLSMTITSTDNPVAGTYVFNGASGKISGSSIGLILSMTLKPDATGTTYTFSGSADDGDTSLSGTMTGVESSTTVTYNVLVKK